MVNLPDSNFVILHIVKPLPDGGGVELCWSLPSGPGSIHFNDTVSAFHFGRGMAIGAGLPLGIERGFSLPWKIHGTWVAMDGGHIPPKVETLESIAPLAKDWTLAEVCAQVGLSPFGQA